MGRSNKTAAGTVEKQEGLEWIDLATIPHLVQELERPALALTAPIHITSGAFHKAIRNSDAGPKAEALKTWDMLWMMRCYLYKVPCEPLGLWLGSLGFDFITANAAKEYRVKLSAECRANGVFISLPGEIKEGAIKN